MGTDALKRDGVLAHLGVRNEHLAVIVLCLLLTFGFLGARGIWDPDEGRYTNVALTMLDTGDWLNPMRNEDTGHWTKPPVTYWMIASSVALFGHTPWSARLPIALSYLACMLLVGLTARRLLPGSAPLAVVVYATMLLPYFAGQLVTTDFPLAAFLALAMYAFVEYRFGDPKRRVLFLLIMWSAFAAAFMTKGPPALTPLLVLVAMRFLAPGPGVRWYWHAIGIGLFATLALPWFIAVSARHPGLLQYFLGAELVDRVASNRFGRHGEWYGWLQIYLPTLVLGTLPWTMHLWRWARQLPAKLREWRRREARLTHARALFIALWIVIPVLVFCLAQSRLPLYLLPTFVPIALAIAQQRSGAGLGLPRWPWLILWVALLLAARVAAANLPTHKDASVWANAIRERVGDVPVHEVVFVEDMARYGLHLHMGVEIEKLSRLPTKEPRFNPEYDEPLMQEVVEVGYEAGLIFITKESMYPEIAKSIATHGYTPEPLGSPYQGRVIFRVHAPHQGRTPASD